MGTQLADRDSERALQFPGANRPVMTASGRVVAGVSPVLGAETDSR
jgi:hypothetical protein